MTSRLWGKHFPDGLTSLYREVVSGCKLCLLQSVSLGVSITEVTWDHCGPECRCCSAITGMTWHTPWAERHRQGRWQGGRLPQLDLLFLVVEKQCGVDTRHPGFTENHLLAVRRSPPPFISAQHP